MSRSHRLLDLMQLLRRRRNVVTAGALAEELGVSSRTIYRDIATLASLGLPIRGEAGIGFLLGSGSFLPPLHFTEDELDALLLGLLWVERCADRRLQVAALDALAKIHEVTPEEKREPISGR